MQILGIIMIIVGAALMIIGKNVVRSMPPGAEQDEDDGFLQLLQGMSRVLFTGGLFFCGAGVICVLIGVLG
ncbi:MAG: hypothetical protein NC300_04620 [Bacteroidales bacterium]|nr:hypothetical protein [Clostridium sp.]MCM1203404.1 hypothetical protein [Bacteroidales bacterium]